MTIRWDDAINRIDVVVGRFPIWKELYRYTSETGNGNALFTGKKEPLRLQVDVKGNELTVTLSLLSDPSKFVTTTYRYNGATKLATHNVGLRSAFNDAYFDDFEVKTLSVGGSADASSKPQKPSSNIGANTTPDTGDTFNPQILGAADGTECGNDGCAVKKETNRIIKKRVAAF